MFGRGSRVGCNTTDSQGGTPAITDKPRQAQLLRLRRLISHRFQEKPIHLWQSSLEQRLWFRRRQDFLETRIDGSCLNQQPRHDRVGDRHPVNFTPLQFRKKSSRIHADDAGKVTATRF